MTDQERKVMEMALKALEAINEMSKPPMNIPLAAEIDDAMDALRQALKQQALSDSIRPKGKSITKVWVDEINQALAQPEQPEIKQGWDVDTLLAQPEQEPVAYACKDDVILAKHWTSDEPPSGWVSLYAAPPSKQEQEPKCCPECSCHFYGSYPFNYEVVERQLHPKEVIKLALKAGFTKDAINVWLVSMEKLIAFAAPPSKQEPVAWLDEEMDMAYTVNEVADADGTDFIPLYTAPPSKPWVSLTNEQISSLKNLQGANRERTATEMAFAVDAKLKELNHG